MVTDSTFVPRSAQQATSRWRRSLLGETVRTFSRHRAALVGALFLALLLVVVLVGPQVAPYDPAETILTETKESPSFDHWMGTDQ